MKRNLVVLVLAASLAGLTACGSDDSVGIQSAAADQTAVTGQNAVTKWAAIVQPAIHNATEPRPAGSSEVLGTIAHLAVYDAVMAIEGGWEPYTTDIEARDRADVQAAVATAAYRTALGRVAPSQFGYLDEKYGAYLAGIPDGQTKTDGVSVGEAAAAAVLDQRRDDGCSNVVSHRCSAQRLPVGEFEPNDGWGTEPLDAKIATVKPFTFDKPAQFRADGPDRFASKRWVENFNEVKGLRGRGQLGPHRSADRPRLLLVRARLCPLEPQPDRPGPRTAPRRHHRRLRGQVHLPHLASPYRHPAGCARSQLQDRLGSELDSAAHGQPP